MKWLEQSVHIMEKRSVHAAKQVTRQTGLPGLGNRNQGIVKSSTAKESEFVRMLPVKIAAVAVHDLFSLGRFFDGAPGALGPRYLPAVESIVRVCRTVLIRNRSALHEFPAIHRHLPQERYLPVL